MEQGRRGRGRERAEERGSAEQEGLSGQWAVRGKAKEQVRTAKALLAEKPANKNAARLNKKTISLRSTKASE
jgi:hypothetical protein